MTGTDMRREWGRAVPTCPVCTDVLGREGGPCSLPCGHNGCFFCLRDVQTRKPECPLCRKAFPADYPLHPNPDLKQLVTTATFNAGGVDDEGWESVPSRANAVRMYAADLEGALVATNMDNPGRTQGGLSNASTPRSTQSIVRDVAAQHIVGNAGPMAIVSASFNANGAPVHSYESILSWVPPLWMPDSCAPSCKGCCLPFKPVMRLRHHCRLCGMVFCHSCSSKKLLLPPKFGYNEPQRVCDSCFEVMKPADLQNALAGHFSKAAQMPYRDVTDWTSMRAWLNNPLTSSLEQDIFKCTNILTQFISTSRLHAERSIPAALLQNAAGYAILSVLKIGCGWSASIGTGLLVSRMQDGSWSAPSAIGLAGCGWGLQAGGELTDLLLVLANAETVKAFCGDVHLGVAGNVNVTMGPVGRDACASMTVGKRGYAMVYSYSCSRGAYVGVSIDGVVTHTRSNANLAFYGRPLTAKDLLLGGCVDAPPAARTLYQALDSMMNSFGYASLQSHTLLLQGARSVMPGAGVLSSQVFDEEDLDANKARSAPAAVGMALPEAGRVSEEVAPSAPPQPDALTGAADVAQTPSDQASEMSDIEEVYGNDLFS